MSDAIMLPKNFVVDRVSYSSPKQLENGGKSIFINYNDKQLLVQTPDMTAPFGVSFWPGERGSPDKYNLDLSFVGREARPALREFETMLDTLCTRVISDAMENSQAWFKRRFPSLDVVEALFTHSVKKSKDRETGEINDKFPPNFKASLPFRDGKFLFPVFDGHRNMIDLMDVVNSETKGKGSRVTAIVQCSAVWIAGGKFGLTWKVKQLKLAEPARLTGYSFQPTDEDVDDLIEDVDVAPSHPTPRRARDVVVEEARELLMHSSDEEDDSVTPGDAAEDAIESVNTNTGRGKRGKPATH